jgi:hypothetical protein
VVNDSIDGRYRIEGCDFDETDPSKFIIKLLNHDELTLEIRFIKINNNECTCKISIVNLSQDIQLHSNIKSLITSLNNYLVISDFDTKIFFNINENKVLIHRNLTHTKNVLCVPGTNDFIFSSWNEVHLMHFNEIQNELEVKKIIQYDDRIYHMKIQNDLVIIKMENESIYLYKLDDIKINNISDPIFINKNVHEYCFSLDKNKFILKTRQDELFVYKIDDEMKQIACLKLNEETNCLVSSDKYISMLNTSKENIFTFEIIHKNI